MIYERCRTNDGNVNRKSEIANHAGRIISNRSPWDSLGPEAYDKIMNGTPLNLGPDSETQPPINRLTSQMDT